MYTCAYLTMIYLYIYNNVSTYTLTYAPEGRVDVVTNFPRTCIYVFVCMYVYIYKHENNAGTHVHTYIGRAGRPCHELSMYMFICTYTYKNIKIMLHIYTHMYVHTHICTRRVNRRRHKLSCTCIYVCIHINI